MLETQMVSVILAQELMAVNIAIENSVSAQDKIVATFTLRTCHESGSCMASWYQVHSLHQQQDWKMWKQASG